MGWVQSVSGSGTGGGTQSITVTAGNAIVVSFLSNTGGDTLTVSDGQGSYTLVVSANPGATATLGLFVLGNVTGGAHSLTLSCAAVGAVWVVSEYSGIKATTTGSAGQRQVGPGTGAGAITPGAYSTGANDTNIGSTWDVSGGTTVVASSGTSRFAATVNTERCVVEDQVGSSPTTFTDATGGGANQYFTVGASFQPIVPTQVQEEWLFDSEEAQQRTEWLDAEWDLFSELSPNLPVVYRWIEDVSYY